MLSSGILAPELALSTYTYTATVVNAVASGTLTLDGYINGATENSAGVGAVACGDVWTLGWTLAGTLPASSTEEYCSNAVDVPVMGWAGLVALFGGLAGVTRLARRVK